MPTPTVIKKYRYSDVINRRYWDNKYLFDAMNVNPAITQVGGAAAAGAGAEVDVMITPTNAYEFMNIVANANIGPQLDGSFGLNLAADAVSGDGVEYDTGITPENPFTFLIDTTGAKTPAFFIKAQFQVSTVAGVDPLIIGFRKLAARNADYTTYSDFASIGLIGGAGEFETATQIATAGVITTDTTQAAADTVVFEVALFVDSFGNVTYQINGQTPTVTVAYQFANGLTLMPFIRVVQSATTTATCSCNYFEVGFQS